MKQMYIWLNTKYFTGSSVLGAKRVREMNKLNKHKTHKILTLLRVNENELNSHSSLQSVEHPVKCIISWITIP